MASLAWKFEGWKEKKLLFFPVASLVPKEYPIHHLLIWKVLANPSSHLSLTPGSRKLFVHSYRVAQAGVETVRHNRKRGY